MYSTCVMMCVYAIYNICLLSEAPGTTTQTNKEPTPDSTNTAAPTVTSAAKEGTCMSLKLL